ncbi:MAG: cyclic pyranopterin monophosphate synthase MoaC [Phycisphaerales bacterium]
MPDPDSPASRLSHLTPDGRAHMVDVGDKPITARSATAEGFVRVSHELAARIRENSLAKGSLLEVARLAGIQAAKRTDELIPLCHTLPLDAIDVRAELLDDRVRIVATARTQSRTGVEMEALTAVAVSCLTVIDMGKAVDKGMVIEGVRVLEKTGGRSGAYTAPERGTP